MKRRDRNHKIIDSAVHIHDKVIFILSEKSLEQEWAENEIEAALAKEKKYGMTLLLPIALDDSIKYTDKPWAVKLRRTHHIHDFTQWKDDQDFQENFEQLCRLLEDDYQETVQEDFFPEEEFNVKTDRAAAVVNQMIAWNNLRYKSH
jgi:hypothetical protein